MTPVLCAIECIGLLMMCRIGNGMVVGFIILTVVVTFFYGGAQGFLAPLTSDLFGSKNFGFNYSIILQAATIANIMEPWIATFGSNKGYSAMFTLCAAMAAGAVVLSIILRKLRKNNLEIIHKVSRD